MPHPTEKPARSAKTRRRRRRRVAVLIDFSRGYGRGLLRGVAQYARQHHAWSVQSEEWRWADAVPPWLRTWTGDGVIVWAEAPQLVAVINDLGVPAVDVRGISGWGFPIIDTENDLVATLAADHFMQRGFRHYAFCGFVGANYSDKRSAAFERRVASAGYECAVYHPPESSGRDAQVLEYEKRGLLFQDHLARWLDRLPKPVGIMACNDIRGQQILNACRRIDVAVPEDVAVVGVDNDEVFCDLSDPPLTSVALDTLKIGYEAAALLEHLMAGGKPPSSPILVPPLGIITRRSSDVLAMEDKHLATGARFIREHAFEDISVADVARAAGMSRRVFERRFSARVGRAPKAEIQRLRLERVKALLVETDWTLERIAEQTGYKHMEYLHTVFSSKEGITPRQYRLRRQREIGP